MAAEPLIVMERVTKRFGGVVAVEDLCLTIGRGEIVAVVGRTGSGKSTAMQAIIGTFPVDAGRVRVAGRDPYAERRALRGQLAVAFQTDRLLPWRRTWENVAIGLEIFRVPRARREAIAREWLARVKMAGAEEKYPHELSGGMRQRASFARALAVDPAIVLLDETFSQLDELTSRELRGDFMALVRSLGKTSILITHRIDEALEVGDRVVVFGQPGHVIHEVATSPDDRSNHDRLAKLRAEIKAVMAE